jgi:hypothetical protein
MEIVSALSNLRASAGVNQGQSQRQNRFSEKARQNALLQSVANDRVLPGRFVADEGRNNPLSMANSNCTNMRPW